MNPCQRITTDAVRSRLQFALRFPSCLQLVVIALDRVVRVRARVVRRVWEQTLALSVVTSSGRVCSARRTIEEPTRRGPIRGAETRTPIS